MTPARKAALQWFHDRGEVKLRGDDGQPSPRVINLLLGDLLLEFARPKFGMGAPIWRLTDKGRRMLHGDNA